MKQMTTIQISKANRDKLCKLRTHPRVPVNDVLDWLLRDDSLEKLGLKSK